MTSAEIAIFGIACTAIGALINHLIRNRLAIDRDKRSEFNKLIDPICHTVMMQGIPTDLKFKLIREHLHFWKRSGFDRAVEAYKKSMGEDNRESDGGGCFSYKDKTLIVHAANDLLKYLKPR